MSDKVASDEMERYFSEIDKDVRACYEVAEEARKIGFEPERIVDVKLAKNMAERVEGLISAAAPKLVGSGMTDRIMELENEYGPLDWRVALVIAEEVAKEKFCSFEDKREAMEVGLRVGFAYHTSGIVAAPLEGLVELKIKKRMDGKEYFSPCYAGPIRGAGGTASSFSLVLTDYVRKKMGYSVWDPTDNEVGRLKTEISDYHDRVTNLQYFPSDEELDFLVRHLPVEISGDPTEKFEVSNFKDIERIGSNRIRGGVCLVLAEGIAQKAPKIWKRLEKWGEDFGLEWQWLEKFLEIKKKVHAKGKGEDKKKEGEKPKLTPNYTFIKDLVAGRPVLAFPMKEGGFRLRYGRSRMTGFSSTAIHPATMVLVKEFIVTGTQLKIERPGKAASVLPCDNLLAPVVKLNDGRVLQVKDEKEAKNIVKDVEKILYMGDMLFNYGDFSENGHSLVPCGYNEDWYARELEAKSEELFGEINYGKLAEKIGADVSLIRGLIETPNKQEISFLESIRLCESLDMSLHPYYTYFWNVITNDELKELLLWLRKASVKYYDDDVDENAGGIKGGVGDNDDGSGIANDSGDDNGNGNYDGNDDVKGGGRSENRKVRKIILPLNNSGKCALEKLAVPHMLVNNEFVVIEKGYAAALLKSLGKGKADDVDFEKTVIENVNTFSEVNIRDKAGTFIGARMGRPEKAKHRKMAGSPHCLFPVGEEGGRLRSFQAALEKGYVEADFILKFCKKCNKYTIYSFCETCGEEAEQKYYCQKCQKIMDKEECGKHGKCQRFKTQRIDIKHYYNSALKKLGYRQSPELVKGVRGTTNEDHVPEHLTKGILRAKHNLYVNKDGTIRFDMTELACTHFKPFEIGTSVEKLKEMGYFKDCYGEEITRDDQIVELKPHDIILPAAKDALEEQSDTILFRVGKFIDELLQTLYGLKPYYNFKKKEDVIGHYVVGLAPHTSAGTVGRIIGFTDTQGFIAHPLMHAAFRRDCDGDEAAIFMLMDALLNFSRQYLPNSRGAKTMDAPLVLSSRVIPTEVDDMVHGLDMVWKYPLEFYKAADEFKMPWDIKIDQVEKYLNTEKQYEGYGFTHDLTDINMGSSCSAYKKLPSMEEKLNGQMELAEKIMAVDECQVATFVIEKHFLKDTKGNLRKFSMQQFRCVKCNEKFRRPPLIGKCTECGGRLIFTISEGSVIKYLAPSIDLSNKYNVSSYLKQSLELLSQRVDEVFGRDKEKQEGLGKWFS